jgi:chromosome segregation ATPase
MKFTPAALLVGFLCSAVSPLFINGIDLMALKKQEDERRKKLGQAKIKVTDANVNLITVGNKKYGFIQMEADGDLQKEKLASTAGEEKKNDETMKPDFWKKQQADLEERIAKLREEIDSGQAKLNSLWSDFRIKNIPAEQAAIQDQISQLNGEIEQKKLLLSEAEAQIEALSEKARKAGVPPGWLR